MFIGPGPGLKFLENNPVLKYKKRLSSLKSLRWVRCVHIREVKQPVIS